MPKPKREDSTNGQAANTTRKTASKNARQTAELPSSIASMWFIPAKEVQSKDTEWYLDGFVQKNNVAILQGDKGVAKSTWLRAIVAHVTGGTQLSIFKSRKRSPGNVLWYASEEELETRVKPGLEAAGAKMDRVTLSDNNTDGERQPLRLLRDANSLVHLSRHLRAELVIIDPIFNFTDGQLDIEGLGTPARAFMQGLQKICREAPITMIFTRNLVKDRTRGALAAGRGAGELGNVARSVLHLGVLPDGETYALTCASINGQKTPTSQSYKIASKKAQSTITLTGPIEITADELLGGEGADLDRTQLTRAKILIQQMIPEGRLNSRVVKEKAEAAMISVRTLQIAAKQLGITAEQEGSRETTISYWSVPEDGWPK